MKCRNVDIILSDQECSEKQRLAGEMGLYAIIQNERRNSRAQRLGVPTTPINNPRSVPTSPGVREGVVNAIPVPSAYTTNFSLTGTVSPGQYEFLD